MISASLFIMYYYHISADPMHARTLPVKEGNHAQSVLAYIAKSFFTKQFYQNRLI